MKVKITRELLRDINPGRKQQDIADTEMQGFGVRVMPSGVISYVVRYRQKDGRQTRHAIGRYPLMTVSAAREAARQTLASITKGADPKDKPRVEHTLKSFLEQEYKAWVATHHRNPDKTVGRIRKCFAKFYARPLNAISPWILEKWRGECLKRGTKPSTINRDIVMLKGLLSVAVKFKQLTEHPLKGFSPLKETDGEMVRFLSDDEEARLRAALDAREERERAGRASANLWRRERGYVLLPDLRARPFIDHLKPMVLLSLNTGMRQGEVFNLRWPQCALDRSLLTVKGESAKSGKARHI
ncbi:MAG: integrase family protein, partial [Burkholderiales bacterium]|nr:integrase family protein [Burkholderiales bacterium]